MKKLLIFITTILIITSCSTSKKTSDGGYGSPNLKQELIDDNTFKITRYSKDSTYGYTEKNPIMVGGNSIEGVKNERRFINALCCPNGEKLEYYRIGSCCPFESKNSVFGGMLDMYSVTYRGLNDSLVIYINMYDSDILRVPVGLKLKK